MTQKFANAARAYLASTVSDSATTVTIDSGGSLFPAITAPDFSRAVLQDNTGIEVVLITAHTASSNSFTVTRAQEGTTARSFAAGSVFGIRVTAADMDEAIGAGGLTYVTKTANYTAVDKEGVLADTSGGAFTVTLPPSPSTGAQVVVADAGGAWGTNNLTVGRNGSTISGLAENLICDISGASIQFVYDGATWEIYTQIGGNGGTAVTLTSVQTMTNKTVEAGVFTNGYTEETVTANTGTAYTIDLANGSVQYLTLTGSCTYTFPTPVAGKSFMLIQKQDGTGSRTVTWPASVDWPNATAPILTATASKADKFVFTAIDGSNWLGSVAGQNYTV